MTADYRQLKNIDVEQTVSLFGVPYATIIQSFMCWSQNILGELRQYL